MRQTTLGEVKIMWERVSLVGMTGVLVQSLEPAVLTWMPKGVSVLIKTSAGDVLRFGRMGDEHYGLFSANSLDMIVYDGWDLSYMTPMQVGRSFRTDLDTAPAVITEIVLVRSDARAPEGPESDRLFLSGQILGSMSAPSSAALPRFDSFTYVDRPVGFRL